MMTSDNPNPYYREPRPDPPTAASLGVEEVSLPECWRLLAGSTLGRLAMQSHDGDPDVFPLNYLVRDGSLYIRSAPGSKLRSLASHPAVAFEVDGEEHGFHWSVVIRGTAERMDTDAAIEASGVLELESNSPTHKRNYVHLVPKTITGRRFPARRTAADDDGV